MSRNIALAYCSLQDVKNILQTAQNIVRVGPADSDNLTEATIDEYIEDVERRIDAKIAFKYSVPLAVPVDDIVNQITKYQAAYDIYTVLLVSRTAEVIPAAVKAWMNLADDLLTDVVEGRISLTVLPAEGVGKRASTSHLKKIREVEVKLSSFDWSAIGYKFIVKESFIVRPVKDGVAEFKLGIDFDADWKEGKIRRITGTLIPDGRTVYCYFLYLETTDYQKSLRQENLFVDEGYA